jgi:hypothetical protein
MSDDLVKRLRDDNDNRHGGTTVLLTGLAADRIEELEAKLDLSEGALNIASRSWGECQRIIKELEDQLQNQTHLIEQLFALLDIKEQKDDGRYFHPNIIRSSRALDAEKLEEILVGLRRSVTE